jgi:hypothetical protein
VDVIFGLRRALSCSLRCKAGTVENRQLLEGQPEGDLRSFFSSTHTDDESVESAFRNAGGTILARATSGEVSAVALSVDEARRIVLRISASEDSSVELRLAIPHSITH